MLIEFSVTNCLSIKERQTLSMVASKSTELADTHTFDAPIEAGKSGIKLLRSAAIYGANAAGKTNLLIAMRIMQQMVVQSASEQHRGDTFLVKPFLLDAKTRKAPCEFEMHIVVGGVRYQYGFSVTTERIMEEWLIAYPRNRAQHWFRRSWVSRKKEYKWEFSTLLTGEKNIWKKTTRSNALFLSTAVQLNSQQLQPLYDWFNTNMSHLPSTTPGWNVDAYLQKKNYKDKYLNFLNAADLGIEDLRVREEKFDPGKVPEDMPEPLKQVVLQEMKGKKVYDVRTVYLDAAGKPVALELGHESNGTRKMLSITGIWIEALEQGHCVFVDELHSQLHPELVKFLVRQFHNTKTNPNNAQLIFTTHETALLNQKFMRRDQIWFCEKDQNGATTVYPLTDFRPQKGRENLELGYISGAYGALPYIREA